MVFIPLPESRKAEVDAIVRLASDEVSPTVAKKIVASEIEEEASELPDS